MVSCRHATGRSLPKTFNSTVSIANQPSHTTHIRPGTHWLRLDFTEVWEHRDLIRTLVARDFSARFRQTILGPLWYIAQPLLITLVFTVVFGRVLQVSTDGIPPSLFYLSALISWNYFSQTLGGTGNTFHTNAAILTKVYFPRLVLPISTAISGLVGLAVQVASFLAIIGIHVMQSDDGGDFLAAWWLPVLVLPTVILHTMVLAVGVSLWTSALSAKYRDFQHIMPLLMQAWLYLTPVAYPLSRIPEHWRWAAELNPMVAPVELTRWCFFRSGELDPGMLVTSWIIALVFLLTGIFAFQRIESTFADLA